MLLCLFCISVSGTVTVANAQSIVSDSEKQKQWKSMENGPRDFAPDWYYFFLHKKYSGAEMYWKWDWFNSGFRVRFKEPKSDVKRIMPVRVTAEETQRQKIKKVESERKYIEELYKEELAREADRNVDLMYATYKDEFNRMQDCITDGLLYCMQKSDGKLRYQVDELSRHRNKEVNKASIVFTLPHTEGSLSQVLSILSFYRINLTKIQSLPIIGREWEYQFYVDVVFDNVLKYKQSIVAITPLTKELKILGEYEDGKSTI